MLQHSIQNNCIPIGKFLEFFGLTLDEYLNLDNVPFPIIRSTGRVVYRRGTSFSTYDMDLGSPEDTDRSSISEYTLLDECFVDLSTFTFSSEINFVFRFGFSPVDESRTRFRDTYIETQTKESSTDVYLSNTTGINRADLALPTTKYPFTSLDLINGVSPLHEKINSGKYTGSVVDGQLIVTATRTTLFGNNTMSNASTAVTSVLDQNKLALITATKLEVGTLALDLLTEQVLKTLPTPLQLIITNNPLVKIAVANLVNVIILQTGLNDPKVQAVNEAMLTVSWMETIKTFDFKSILDGVISNIPAGKVDALVAAKPSNEGA